MLVGGFIEPPEEGHLHPTLGIDREDKLHGETLLGKEIEINKARCPC